MLRGRRCAGGRRCLPHLRLLPPDNNTPSHLRVTLRLFHLLPPLPLLHNRILPLPRIHAVPPTLLPHVHHLFNSVLVQDAGEVAVAGEDHGGVPRAVPVPPDGDAAVRGGVDEGLGEGGGEGDGGRGNKGFFRGGRGGHHVWVVVVYWGRVGGR